MYLALLQQNLLLRYAYSALVTSKLEQQLELYILSLPIFHIFIICKFPAKLNLALITCVHGYEFIICLFHFSQYLFCIHAQYLQTLFFLNMVACLVTELHGLRMSARIGINISTISCHVICFSYRMKCKLWDDV